MLVHGVGFPLQLMELVEKGRIFGYFISPHCPICQSNLLLSYEVNNILLFLIIVLAFVYSEESVGSWENGTGMSTESSAMLFRALNGLIERL